ncbi:MAG: hypothetical protein R3B84_13025 [Zavarzinella sp.]
MTSSPSHHDLPQKEILAERLLQRHFKEVVPKNWPKAPVVNVVPEVASAPVSNPSRWSLAASVALIFGGLWLISNFAAPGSAPVNRLSIDGGTASTKIIKDLAAPEPVQPE